MNKEFSRLLLNGLKSVAFNNRKNLADIIIEVAKNFGYTEFNVQRWCYKGIVPVEVEQVERLCEYCVRYGQMSKAWAENFLAAANYRDSLSAVGSLFPNGAPNEIDQKVPDRLYISMKLPSRTSHIVGREQEFERAVAGLRIGQSKVCIVGLPGIGKTELALEITHHFSSEHDSSRVPTFDAIVWISARTRPEQKQWFAEVLNRIAETYGYEFVLELPIERKQVQVDKLLREFRTLIILDNFDTMADDHDLIDWLYRLPSKWQILFTGRQINLRDTWLVELAGLSEKQSLQLIRSLATAKNLNEIAHAHDDLLLPLVEVTGGNPAAIDMALGHIKYCATLDEVVEQLKDGADEVKDIFRYVVAWAWDSLPHNARNLMMVLPLFANAVNKDALAAVSNLSGFQLEDALVQVMDRSFLKVEGELDRKGRRYSVHPIVRAYASSMLSHDVEYENQAWYRLTTYYLEFVESKVRREKIDEPYWRYLGGGVLTSVRDEWQNLLTVLRWIDQRHDHHLMVEFMMRIVHYMDRNAYHPIRLEYGRKAASAAHQLNQKDMEALFRIDALSVTFRKIGHFDEAIHEIQMGLDCISQMEEQGIETSQLKALGFAFMAKTYAEKGDIDESSQWIEYAMQVEPHCSPVLRHRILLTSGDILFAKKEYTPAKDLYLRALEMVHLYSMEGDTDAAGVYRKLGYCNLELSEIAEAEERFNEVIRYKTQGGVLNDAFAKYGLAKVNRAKDQFGHSRKLAMEAKEILERVNAGHPLLKDIATFIKSLG